MASVNSFIVLKKCSFFMSGSLPTVTRGISRFSRLLSLNTRVSETCSLINSYIFSGKVLSTKANLCFSLQHPSAKMKMIYPDRQRHSLNVDTLTTSSCIYLLFLFLLLFFLLCIPLIKAGVLVKTVAIKSPAGSLTHCQPAKHIL